MIYIQKRKTPVEIKEKAEEIKRTPDSCYDEIVLPEDSKQLRRLFDQMPKDQIRQALYEEQHGLCAYCMKRITPFSCDTKIEHYKALSEDKERALDYQNYLGVCYGGEKDGDEKVMHKISFRDSRGDFEFFVYNTRSCTVAFQKQIYYNVTKILHKV